jgi:hypothetical protein
MKFPVPDEPTLIRMALYFDMRQKALSGQRKLDSRADTSFLDHPGLNDWLDKVRNQHGIQNTCYTSPPPGLG